MKKQERRSLARLIVGFLLNAALFYLFLPMTMVRDPDRVFHAALLGGSLAGTAIVIVVPVFWRGVPWQVPLAFVLLWLPGLVLFMALSFASR